MCTECCGVKRRSRLRVYWFVFWESGCCCRNHAGLALIQVIVLVYWLWLLCQGSPRAGISVFPSALLQSVIYTVKSHLVSLCWISTLGLFSFGICTCQEKRFVTILLLGQAAIVLLISHPPLLVGNYPRSRVSLLPLPVSDTQTNFCSDSRNFCMLQVYETFPLSHLPSSFPPSFLPV